jgi:hypothetical protein
MRRIDSSSLEIDKSDEFLSSYFESIPFDYVFEGNEEPTSEYNKFKWILEDSVPTIINKKFETFGQPDAYDQCGYYISYSIGEKKYQALVDPDNVPSELVPITSKLFKREL